MKAKDYRLAARNKLRGKWGTMALATLIYGLIMAACVVLAFFYIGTFASLFLTGALTLGLIYMALNAARLKEVRVKQIFDGFKNYASSLALYLLIAIFTFLWTLLLIIPGIIKMYSYSMSWYILADNPDMPVNQARKKSMELMKGNKWRLFCLHFSFIGWYLLGILTLGILFIWIIPYINTAEAEFYCNLFNKNAAPSLDDTLAEPYAPMQ